ncbi:hypothetical protein Tco_1158307, partial [Tanacetum coccineum]
MARVVGYGSHCYWSVEYVSKGQQTRLCVLRDKFKNVKEALKKWSKTRFGGLNKKIEDYSKEAMRWELEAEKRSLGDVERTAW